MCTAKVAYIAVPSKRRDLNTKIHHIIPQETWIISDTAVRYSNPARLDLYNRQTAAHCASGYWPINKLKGKRTQWTTSRSPLSTCQFLSTVKDQTDSKQNITCHILVSTVIFGNVIIGKSTKMGTGQTYDVTRLPGSTSNGVLNLYPAVYVSFAKITLKYKVIVVRQNFLTQFWRECFGWPLVFGI
jgi:hypothetical protein